ncbi:MAG TPA: hypothetical protein ENK43_11585 [Planctomycetes bacterium]|nr:hypothetical protein [Planctomycetota bacterium]
MRHETNGTKQTGAGLPFHPLAGWRHGRLVAISLHAPDGRFIDATEELASVVGRPLSMFESQRIDELVVEADPEAIRGFMDEITHRGQSQHRLHLFVPGRGLRWLELSGTWSLHPGAEDLIQVIWRDETEKVCRPPRSQHGDPTAVSELLQSFRDPRQEEPAWFAQVLRALRKALRAPAAFLGHAAPSREGVEIVAWSGAGATLGPSLRQDESFARLGTHIKDVVRCDHLEKLLPQSPLVLHGEASCLILAPLTGHLSSSQGFLCIIDPPQGASAEALTALTAHRLGTSLDAARLDALVVEARVDREIRRRVHDRATRTGKRLQRLLARISEIDGASPLAAELTPDLRAIVTDCAAMARWTGDTDETRRELDLDEILGSAIAMAESDVEGLQVDHLPAPMQPRAAVVPEQLRQALVDLLRAMSGEDGRPTRIHVRTLRAEETGEEGGRRFEIAIRPEHAPPQGGNALLDDALHYLNRVVGRHGGMVRTDAPTASPPTIRIILPSAAADSPPSRAAQGW